MALLEGSPLFPEAGEVAGKQPRQQLLGARAGFVHLWIGEDKNVLARRLAVQFRRGPGQQTPPALCFLERPALESQVAEQIERLIRDLAAEGIVDDAAQQADVARRPAFFEPFAGLAIHAIAVEAQAFGRQGRETKMAKIPGLHAVPCAQRHEVVAGLVEDALQFIDGFRPVLFGDKFVRCGQAATRAARFPGQTDLPQGLVFCRRLTQGQRRTQNQQAS